MPSLALSRSDTSCSSCKRSSLAVHKEAQHVTPRRGQEAAHHGTEECDLLRSQLCSQLCGVIRDFIDNGHINGFPATEVRKAATAKCELHEV